MEAARPGKKAIDIKEKLPEPILVSQGYSSVMRDSLTDEEKDQMPKKEVEKWVDSTKKIKVDAIKTDLLQEIKGTTKSMVGEDKVLDELEKKLIMKKMDKLLKEGEGIIEGEQL